MNQRDGSQKYILNVQEYSLDELLGLFDLTSSSPLTVAQMKSAKHQVFKMHPDKSGLPSEYFLFYQQAYNLLHQHFTTLTRTTQTPTMENTTYTVENKTNGGAVKTAVQNMDPGLFQETFHQFFQESTDHAHRMKRRERRAQWFSESPPPNTSTSSPRGVGGSITEAMQKHKEQQRRKEEECGVVRRTEVDVLPVRSLGTDYFHDTEADDADADAYVKAEYVSCDPFSKLKYDDLRKVHKDETVFSVSEHDVMHRTQYANRDALISARRSQDQTIQPTTVSTAERERDESNRKAVWAQKQYVASLRSQHHEKQAQTFLATFLQLTH